MLDLCCSKDEKKRGPSGGRECCMRLVTLLLVDQIPYRRPIVTDARGAMKHKAIIEMLEMYEHQVNLLSLCNPQW